MLSITSHQGRSNHDHSEVLHNFLRKDIITNTGNKNSLEGKREIRIVVHCCWKHKEMLWNVQMWQNMAKTNVASFHMVKHGEYCMNLQFCSCVYTSGNGASPSHVNRWLVCRVNLSSNQEVVGYLLYIHVRIAPVVIFGQSSHHCNAPKVHSWVRFINTFLTQSCTCTFSTMKGSQYGGSFEVGTCLMSVFLVTGPRTCGLVGHMS